MEMTKEQRLAEGITWAAAGGTYEAGSFDETCVSPKRAYHKVIALAKEIYASNY